MGKEFSYYSLLEKLGSVFTLKVLFPLVKIKTMNILLAYRYHSFQKGGNRYNQWWESNDVTTGNQSATTKMYRLQNRFQRFHEGCSINIDIILTIYLVINLLKNLKFEIAIISFRIDHILIYFLWNYIIKYLHFVNQIRMNHLIYLKKYFQYKSWQNFFIWIKSKDS